ncbi:MULTISPECIES: MBL fold metallo-hydrolase [unclassified Dyella]|uniref:MBL fold metallo-hydrolase n=1 Tax=unclassified Dyella TaxID=2634549 RepID=UPI000C82EE3B|nr:MULTISPECIES: MBL fold metallo-hydrolase [unclassified Dyella]MDR3443633.1 MBL fold metallo-hydrolase [Dyella sp.]PMQ02613.1 Hydroxyacylglutathione hydrolase [Dyella sp. AD56]
MKYALIVLCWMSCLLGMPALAQPAPGDMNVHWDPGAADCQARPPKPLQVHRYDQNTYILRESLCQTYEGPFIYLLIGSSRALLIDTGDVTDASKMPLASTVLGLLPVTNGKRLPLLIAHTHGHLDHRSGDGQFASAPDVAIVGTDLPHVIDGFGFRDWPNDIAHIDLGSRTVDVIATPGHYPSHVSFYDNNTGLAFTGDFLLPGRLIIDDTDADRASASRINQFLHDRPVTYVLGGHVELDRSGQAEPMGSTWHPDEAPLALGKQDLAQLPQVLAAFNGFYSQSGRFVMYSQTRMLQVAGTIAILLLVVIALSLRWWFRRRRHARAGHL